MKLSNQFSWESAAITAVAAATGAVATGLLLTSLSNEDGVHKTVPQKWVKVGTVKELTIFPLKSCQGVSISEGIVTRLGLQGTQSKLLRDRVFMIVNKNGVFQVQKEHPKMAVIRFLATDLEMTLSAPGMEDICLELPSYSVEKDIKCKIYLEDNLKGMDCGDEVAAWINRFLGSEGFRLVYHHEKKSQRHLSDMQRQFPHTSPHDVGTFQNYVSYVLIAQESVDDLNTHLKNSVPFNNFRPTILISGILEPYAEVKWGFIRIGEAIFKASKPCERCSIVTVDQRTGIRDPTGDPLKTLSKLPPSFDDDRVKLLLKNKGIMGLQMGLFEASIEDAVIRVDDPVYVALL